MEFHHYFKSRQGEIVNLLKELVSLESPSLDKKAVDKCMDFVIKEFKNIGAKVTRFPQKKIGSTQSGPSGKYKTCHFISAAKRYSVQGYWI